MKEVLKTTDPALLSYAQSLLKDAGVYVMLADQNMSIVEGSIGILPRRLLVPDEDAQAALDILIAADLL